MRDHPKSVMMFAAGFGTRMGALTQTRPKPLVEVAGKPLIDHALELVDAISPDRVVVNLHYLPDQLQKHLARRDVHLSHEHPEILDTGGGLRHALPLLGDGPVFTTNTDAVWNGPNPFALLAEAWEPARMSALLMCVPRDRALGHTGLSGFETDEAGIVRRGPGMIYTGVQIIRPEMLHDIPQNAFSLNLLWDKMLADGRLHILPYPGQWCDVGHPEGIATAEAMLRDV